MFGAVLATGEEGDRLNAGQVRGPVQMTFAQSIDRILPLDAAITRQARTTEKRMETGPTEFGRKAFVPYGLYRSHGYFNPFLADRTGVTNADLEAFWDALRNLFDFDRSASRGEMAVCGLYVFSHDSKLGNAPATNLFQLIRVPPTNGTPREFASYEVVVDETNVPQGVTLSRLVE
jgi:CRISPR-associated protein Csd2